MTLGHILKNDCMHSHLRYQCLERKFSLNYCDILSNARNVAVIGSMIFKQPIASLDLYLICDGLIFNIIFFLGQNGYSI